MKFSYIFYETRLNLFSVIAEVSYEQRQVWGSYLARECSISWVHTSLLLRKFETLGLIIRTRDWGQREIMIQMTNLGWKLWDELSHIKRIFDDGHM